MIHRRAPRAQALLLLCSAIGCGIAMGCGGASSSVRPASVAAPVSAASPVSTPAKVVEPLWYAEENPHARYIAALGEPTAHVDSVSEDQLRHARLRAAQTLLSFPDVELAPADFDRAKLAAESTRRQLLGVFFEWGVVHHDVDARGTHFSINVAVVDLRTENIVASLMGSATAPGPSSLEAEQLALEGALEGAMRGVPQLLASLESPPPAEP